MKNINCKNNALQKIKPYHKIGYFPIFSGYCFYSFTFAIGDEYLKF